MRRSRGFAVIALLAVVAVIALAATLVLTVSVRAREAARKATCLSNVKEICLAALVPIPTAPGAAPDRSLHRPAMLCFFGLPI
jgi:type II secretory pathway component PulK